MKALLAFRKNVQILYSEYSMQVNIFLKFILGLVVFHTINSNLGFMERVSSGMITFVLAVISALLPLMVMVVSAMGLILLHFNELGIAVVTITVVIFTILYVFYFRFTPGRTWVILLVPLAFYFNVPFVVPIIFGLLSGPVMVVPAISGTIVFYLLNYVQTTEISYYAEEGIAESLDHIVAFVNTVTANEEQWLVAFVLGVGVLLVYAIRTRSFRHCWKVAYLAGIFWSFVATRMGGNFLELEIDSTLLWTSAFVALVLGVLFEFLFYNVDYSKTQYLQFDDNDYYYYVKAIPKQVAPEKGRATRRLEDKPDGKESARNDISQRRSRGPGGDGVPRNGKMTKGSKGLQNGSSPLGRLHPDPRKGGLEDDGPERGLQETMVIGSDEMKKSMPKASQIRAETESILLTRSLNSEFELEGPESENISEIMDPKLANTVVKGEKPLGRKRSGKTSNKKKAPIREASKGRNKSKKP